MKLTSKQIKIMSWILMGLSVSGNIFVNGKCVIGMWIWLIGSCGWIVYSKIRKEYALMILNIIYSNKYCWNNNVELKEIKMAKINIWLGGKMSGLSLEKMNQWRLDAIELFKKYTNEVKMINPVEYYNFEMDLTNISEKEIKDFDLTAVRKSDIVLVNFNYPDSIGTAQELQVAEDNHIPIIAFGTEKAHPWMELNVFKRCVTLEEAVKYIVEFYIPILN